MYYIDIGYHDLSEEEYMNEFKKIEANLKNKDGGFAYKQINLSNGIDHTKEYADIGLMLIKSIVYHRKCQNETQLILPKVWQHPSWTQYTILSLRNSIWKILINLTSNVTQAKKIMEKLKEQV